MLPERSVEGRVITRAELAERVEGYFRATHNYEAMARILEHDVYHEPEIVKDFCVKKGYESVEICKARMLEGVRIMRDKAADLEKIAFYALTIQINYSNETFIIPKSSKQESFLDKGARLSNNSKSILTSSPL